MKTYKHLWDEFISAENFDLAARKAVRGKRGRISTQKFLRRRTRKLARLREMLERGEYKTGRYRIFTIYEPKQRQIYMLPLYPDHIVHHALMNILAPIWIKIFLADSYACIPGRGLHPASQKCVSHVRKNKYVLQCDISKFYPSIRHDIMKKIIRKKISDKRMLALLDDIITSAGGDVGMPIGNLTSQWMGNLYLNELDIFVKHHLRARHYIRYCDDFCIFANDTRELARYRDEIAEFIRDNLDLHFSKAFIKPTAVGVNFIGYRHFANHIVLTRVGARKMRRRIQSVINNAEISACMRGRIASLSGWLGWCCGQNLRRRFYGMISNATDGVFARFFRAYF
ncbi:reverse transcriptase [bacterium]|nr:reverse transcriptase [bacterium]